MEEDSNTWVSMPVRAPGFYTVIFVTKNELEKNSDKKALVALKLERARLSLYDIIGIDE